MNSQSYSDALAVLFVLGVCFMTLLVCLSPFLFFVIRAYKRHKADFDRKQQTFNLRAERVGERIEREHRRLLP